MRFLNRNVQLLFMMKMGMFLFILQTSQHIRPDTNVHFFWEQIR